MADGIPVLLYHRVADASSRSLANYTLPAAMFGAHLDALVGDDRCLLSVGELLRRSRSGELTGCEVGLTFDDGYADTVDVVAPVLERVGATATVFVTTGWLDGAPADLRNHAGDPRLSVDGVRQLSLLGHEIGAHTHSHPQLDTLPTDQIQAELRSSKDLLEQTLGVDISGVAWPHGYADDRVRDAARRAGYVYGAGVGNRLWDGRDPWRIDRLMVTSDHDVASVLRWAAGDAPSHRSTDRMRTVGWRLARRARARVSATSAVTSAAIDAEASDGVR